MRERDRSCIQVNTTDLHFRSNSLTVKVTLTVGPGRWPNIISNTSLSQPPDSCDFKWHGLGSRSRNLVRVALRTASSPLSVRSGVDSAPGGGPGPTVPGRTRTRTTVANLKFGLGTRLPVSSVFPRCCASG
jgi:hypothetical protein